MSQNYAAEYVAGAIAGSANVLSGYAFDTCKVRLQASPPSTYRNAWHCFRSILQYEGVRGMYRGVSAPLIGGALETGVNYAVYTYMLRTLGTDVRRPDLVSVAVSAGTAGVVLSPLLSPFELVKCRMQMASLSRTQRPAYSTPWACFQDLLRTEGLKGMTRGIGATMARETPGNALFFVIYEGLRRVVPGRPASAAPSGEGFLAILGDAASSMICGGAAGTIMWATVLPIDAAKTRLQTATPGSPRDVGVIRNLQMMYREGGLGTLYAGIRPTLIRAFPANAAQWLAWEIAMRAYHRSGSDKSAE
ncbi:g13273 [Coccomyxa viridis]|uniref:G13273 protein n=1 Tax=Coccomyxa viridis TaxID=1274662 RepID=A0ABP1GF00_9CHLO